MYDVHGAGFAKFNVKMQYRVPLSRLTAEGSGSLLAIKNCKNDSKLF
jgi:hypothetical protein